jgi:hypothetical protein
MADRNDSSSSMISRQGSDQIQETGAERRSRNVVAEFVDAARSAAESMLEEQKHQIAGRISGIAEALRGAARPLDESQSRILARYLEEAAASVGSFSRRMHERRWNELVADAEAFARRQPTLFVLSSVAAGFVIGRLLWASTDGQQHHAVRSSQSSEPARTVTAAIASGRGAGELAGNATPPAGAVEAR